MEIEPELLEFLIACKKAEKADLLEGLKTEQLEKLHYEIAEDPNIEKEIKKLIK